LTEEGHLPEKIILTNLFWNLRICVYDIVYNIVLSFKGVGQGCRREAAGAHSKNQGGEELQL
jgi:hypothetical protein